VAGIKESREEAPAARSAFVLSRERPSLSTEASSVLPRLKIASQREISFWNSGGLGKRWSQSFDAGASNGCEFRNSLLIHCYSLFFVAEENREFP